MDYNLFHQARDLADQLKHVAVAIDKAQIDTTGLADACKILIDLQVESVLQPHKDHIQHHFTKPDKAYQAMPQGCILDTENVDYQQNKKSYHA